MAGHDNDEDESASSPFPKEKFEIYDTGVGNPILRGT